VPQPPADVLNSIGEAGALLTVFVREVGPAFDGIGARIMRVGGLRLWERCSGDPDGERLGVADRLVRC
jgi:hypothetical protein